MRQINFDAPPICGKFMDSEAFFRIIAGPVGSGKTTACIFELLRRASEQARGTDGLRHTRFAIVRQTLKQLEDTVLKDIMTWLDGLVTYKVSKRTVFVEFGDVRSEWLLIPLDDPDDQRRLLSMQLTGAWLSEAIEMSVQIVSAILGRCGRFPSKGTMPPGHKADWPSWHGAIADTNMPTEGDPWYQMMEVTTPPDWAIYIQPGGLEKGAENLENLPGGRKYYERLVANNTPEWVTRYVHAKYGPDPSGQAVFKDTFKKSFHVISLSNDMRNEGANFALDPIYGYPLVVAQDFGRNPCALICQADHKGRGLVLEEIVSVGIGLELHIEERLLPVLRKERYFNRPVYVVGDPSGNSKGNILEETCFDALKRHGLSAYPAPTNDLDKRLRAVEAMFLQQRDGAAALLIDGDMCPTLTLALSTRYRFAKRANGQMHPTPEKLNPWSDLADCLQYFCLCLQGGMTGFVAERLARNTIRAEQAAPRRRISAKAWT